MRTLARSSDERTRKLRVLAFSAAADATWPLAVLNGLRNHSVELTHVSISEIEAAPCLPVPLLQRLGASADMLLLDLGRQSTSHYATIFVLAERLLRATVAAMAQPSVLLLLYCSRPAADLSASRREQAALHSLSNPLSLFAQFYGLPTCSACRRGVGSGAASFSDEDDALAASALSSLRWRLSHRSDGPDDARSLWQLPARHMLLDGSLERNDKPCMLRHSRALHCRWWRFSEADPAACPLWLSGHVDDDWQQQRQWKRQHNGLIRMRESAAAGGKHGMPRSSNNHTLGHCQRLTGQPGFSDNAVRDDCARLSSAPASASGIDMTLRSVFGGTTIDSGRGSLDSTRAHEGSVRGWARVLAKLDAGKSVSVGVLGGSMSLTASTGHPSNWPEQLAAWMRREWPNASVTLHNGAVGATGSAFFAMCAETRLPSVVDLVVLEHALNDGEHQAVVDAASLRGRALVYEMLVRRLLLRADAPAVFFLSWDRIGWCANLEAAPRYKQRIVDGPYRGAPWLATPQLAVDLIARWYGLPSLAPRNALWHKDCDDLRFRGTFCDSYGVFGCGHLKPLGAAIVSHVLTSFFAESTERVRHEVPGSNRRAPLPPPLIAAVSELQMGKQGGCVWGQPLVSVSHRVISGDWRFVGRDPGQPPTADKPGFLSLTAPSVFEMDIPAPPAGTVALGYLRSYDEKMGLLHVACVRGCACNSTLLTGWHRQRSSVLSMGWLPVRLPDGAAWPAATSPAGCTLRLEHRRSAQGSRSSSKFKLIAVVTPAVVLDHSDFKELEKPGLR